MRRVGRSALVVVCAAALALTACSGPGGEQSSSGGAPPAGSRTGASLFTPDVDQLLVDFQHANLPVANPHDVTDQKCPPIKCTTALDTDTVSILKFPASGPAEIYAGSITDNFVIADIVLVFQPSVSPQQRTAYRQVVKRAIG